MDFPFPLHHNQEEGVTVPKPAHTLRRVPQRTDISASGQNTIKRCSQGKILHHSGQFCATWSPGYFPFWIPNVGYQQGLVWWVLLNVSPLLQAHQSSGTEDTAIYRLLYFQCHTDRLCFIGQIPKIKEKLWGSEGEGNIKVKLKFSRQSVVWLNLREALQSGSFAVSWLPIWHKELSKQVFSKGTHMDHDANSTNWPNFTEIPRHLNKKTLSRIRP